MSGTDDREKFANETFTDFSQKKIKNFSRYTSKGALLAENFNRFLTDFLKMFVFGRNSGDWIDEMNVVTKRYKKEKLSSTQLT